MQYGNRTNGNVAILTGGYDNLAKPNVIISSDSIGARDFANGGVVSGLITTKGTAQVDAIVDLYESISRSHIATAKTNAAGAFSFENMNKNLEFFIVVRGLPEWEWRAKSRFKPV